MRDFEQQKADHSRNIRQEINGQVTRHKIEVLRHYRGLDLSRHQPLLDEEAVRRSFGISEASLMAVIGSPVMEIAALDKETMDEYMDRRNRASAFCFLGSAPGEPPRYYILDRTAVSAHRMLPIDELGISPLEKGGNLIMGRSPHNWMPGRVHDESGNEINPGYDIATSQFQAMFTVTDEGHMEIYDLDSKNGTSVMYNDLEHTQHHFSDVEHGLGTLTVDNTVEQTVPIERW